MQDYYQRYRYFILSYNITKLYFTVKPPIKRTILEQYKIMPFCPFVETLLTFGVFKCIIFNTKGIVWFFRMALVER